MTIPRSITLSQGLSALVDAEDFEWLSQWKWCAHRLRHTTYAKRSLKGILMHREIMQRHGFSFAVVDHANHDGLDNRKGNLRPCSASENQANRSKGSGSSRYKGVHLDAATGLWRAEVRRDGRRLRGPRFADEKDAADWYDEKASDLFGEFALLNLART
jgi:hypothetical protein